MVVSQDGNRLGILVEASEPPLPPFIPFAQLVLSQTDLLERLKERIDEMDGDHTIARQLFGHEDAHVSWSDLPTWATAREMPETQRVALEQALGSSVTFLWGPPGTGKTFSIAVLIAALVERGETVLVTSHTHAAVEQALWASIEPPAEGRHPGPLYESPLIEQGRVLKIGPLKQEKIPKRCSLDSFLDEVAKEHQERITKLLQEQKDVDQRLTAKERELRAWRDLERARQSFETFESQAKEYSQRLAQAQRDMQLAKTHLDTARSEVAKAESSFFIGRGHRMQVARSRMQEAIQHLRLAESQLNSRETQKAAADTAVESARDKLQNARRATIGLAAFETLAADLQELTGRRAAIAEDIRKHREIPDDWANELLDNARALFVTLTKLYMDQKLRSRQWDCVIVDEVSMAMAPLLAIAAARARKRVVVVGDFYQLPPVVHSREGIAHDELATDIFERRGIVDAVERNQTHPQLAQLTVQRRMHPAIADVARTLVYKNRLQDHPETRLRPVPAELANVLGTDNPLVVIDTTELRPWCGKMPGSLSRFNFYSGQAAVEVAAMFATGVGEPSTSAAPPFGVVTPYSAQRRYLSKLVELFNLSRWVTPGTVHTFQGNESDVIVFDSVLGEPHWTARLTDPHEYRQVRKDLNVAVTRARHQFVFVGDAKWLASHAKPGSGFGELWNHLRASATVLNAVEILGDRFRQRVAQSVSTAHGWGEVALPKGMALFDETTFYPAFIKDLRRAKERVILYTPFIGKTRWPKIEPEITALREWTQVLEGQRGRAAVEVYLLHKPLCDPEWRKGDPDFGRAVFEHLGQLGVHLIPMSGIHAKTIVIDGHIVYDGSLNWASQTASHEHMWRLESRDAAALIERMLQLEPLIANYENSSAGESSCCPKCGGELVLVNQKNQNATFNDRQPLKLACLRHSLEKTSCSGHVRAVDRRAPFITAPKCPTCRRRMRLERNAHGKPYRWNCGQLGCKPIRWLAGDLEKG